MIGNITIRQASLPDVDDIVEIENLSFGSDSFSRSQFVYLIEKAKGIFYLAVLDGKPMAYISLLSNTHTKLLRVYSIAVHPQARGKKLAATLLEKAIEYARSRNLKAVTLEVKVTNETAISLYKKNGFQITGVISHYYEDGTDGYAMSLEIKNH